LVFTSVLVHLRGRGKLAVFAITTVAVLAATAILARLGFCYTLEYPLHRRDKKSRKGKIKQRPTSSSR
jgi:hypothetical protein